MNLCIAIASGSILFVPSFKGTLKGAFTRQTNFGKLVFANAGNYVCSHDKRPRTSTPFSGFFCLKGERERTLETSLHILKLQQKFTRQKS